MPDPFLRSTRKQSWLESRRCGKQQATHHSCVLEEVEQLRRMAAVPDASPKGCAVSLTARRKQFHSFYAHGTRIAFEATFIFSVN
jgi:hypothetical protein